MGLTRLGEMPLFPVMFEENREVGGEASLVGWRDYGSDAFLICLLALSSFASVPGVCRPLLNSAFRFKSTALALGVSEVTACSLLSGFLSDSTLCLFTAAGLDWL